MYPRIGISTSYEAGEQRLSLTYVRAVERAGGLPVIMPMLESEDVYAELVRDLDGLVMTGGPAVTDGLIGSLPDDLNPTDPVRVRADRLLLTTFLASRKPMLGICYGMQLMNAIAGGAIYADVERQLEGSLVHSAGRGAQEHDLRILPGTYLSGILGEGPLAVNSRHVQAVAKMGQGFRIAATAPDGAIEAIESEDGTLLGVQFHPERMDEMLPLFQHLVGRARQTRIIGVAEEET